MKLFNLKTTLLVAFVTLTSSCTIKPSFSPAKMGETFPMSRTPEKIEIFRTQLPAEKYTEIGSISACCGTSEKLMEVLRKKASESGGDAIIGIEPYAGDGISAAVIRFNK